MLNNKTLKAWNFGDLNHQRFIAFFQLSEESLLNPAIQNLMLMGQLPSQALLVPMPDGKREYCKASHLN